jgi:hypothetical protein
MEANGLASSDLNFMPYNLKMKIVSNNRNDKSIKIAGAR